MISHRGPYDDRPGVQLLMAAMLGQIYGILSRNPVIRMTSQGFHVMAFSWAKQCGISGHDAAPSDPPMPLDESDYIKEQFWRRWAACHLRQRAMLAHYTIDGLLSRSMGTSTSARHLSNRLDLRNDDHAFTASTLEGFLGVIRTSSPQIPRLTFRSMFGQLLSHGDVIGLTPANISPFNIMVLLEGLQSFLSDTEDERIGPNYAERAPLLSHALLHLHRAITDHSNSNMDFNESLESMLRWHSICLEAIINTSKLCRALCLAQDIEYDLCARGDGLSVDFDLTLWSSTIDGRRALLHAIAIQDIIEQIPRGRGHSMNTPSSLFASATIRATFCLSGTWLAKIPSHIAWEQVVVPSYQVEAPCDQSILSTMAFMRGDFNGVNGTQRNLAYEFNSTEKLFDSLATQWGVSAQMGVVIRQWTALSR